MDIIPYEILDWDYHTFDFGVDDYGLWIALYNDDILRDLPDNVRIEGWITPGLSIKETMFHRDASFEYQATYRPSVPVIRMNGTIFTYLLKGEMYVS